MKTVHVKTRWIILTFAMVMVTTTIFAQRGNENRKAHGSDQEQLSPPPMPPDPPQHQGMVADEDAPPPPLAVPGLTDEQKDKIRKTDLKQMEVMTPLRNQLREKKARLTTVLATPPANIKEAEAIADEIGKLQASILKQQIRHDQELRGLLTPDQQILFDAKPKPFISKPGQGRRR